MEFSEKAKKCHGVNVNLLSEVLGFVTFILQSQYYIPIRKSYVNTYWYVVEILQNTFWITMIQKKVIPFATAAIWKV